MNKGALVGALFICVYSIFLLGQSSLPDRKKDHRNVYTPKVQIAPFVHSKKFQNAT